MSRHRRRRPPRTARPIWIGLAVVATAVVHGLDTGNSASSFRESGRPFQQQTAIKSPGLPKQPSPAAAIESARPSRGEGRTGLATVPATGSGVLRIVAGRDRSRTDGRRITYRVELERGLPFDPAATAAIIHRTLIDPRGWQPIERVAFERINTTADLRIIVASPTTTDRLCQPLDTSGQVSCRVRDRVVLNAMRWAQGTPGYEGRLSAYRSYLVNHEVGHALGYKHVGCPEPDAPAPVMMQQTKGIADCRINSWPSISR